MTAETTRPRRAGRAWLGYALMALILSAALVTLWTSRHDLATAWSRVGVAGFVLSLLFGLLSVLMTAGSWGAVLGGLGIAIPVLETARVFCLSQLGKYLPGSVWPVVAQMSAGAKHGANRRTMFAANILTLLVSLCVGLLVACVLLPTGDHTLLGRYWWLLLAVGPLLALLHPRVFTAVLARLLTLAHREPLNRQLPVSATARAAAWSGLSWLMLGLHLYVLCAALGHGGVRTFLLCMGAMAAAVCVGVLAVPLPAGLGPREAVLVIGLRTVLPHHADIVAVAFASRAVMVVADLLAAAVSASGQAGLALRTEAKRSHDGIRPADTNS